MRALSVFGRLLYLLDHVLAGREIDEGRSAHLLQAHLLLLVARVNGNHSQAHGFGILLSEGSETATSSHNGNSLAGAGVRLLQALVDRDTCAEDRCNCIERNVFVEASNVGGLCNAVLLEGAIDGVSREKSFGAERFIWIIG